jgi:hypothetical protein
VWRPTATGFDAIARFFAEATSLVPGLGLVSLGTTPSEAVEGQDARMRPALLVIPATELRGLAVLGSERVDASAWLNGGLLWTPPSLDLQPIVFAVDGAEGERQVSVTLQPPGELDVYSILLRAMAMGDFDEAVQLVASAQASGDDEQREGCSLLLRSVGRGSTPG